MIRIFTCKNIFIITLLLDVQILPTILSTSLPATYANYILAVQDSLQPTNFLQSQKYPIDLTIFNYQKNKRINLIDATKTKESKQNDQIKTIDYFHLSGKNIMRSSDNFIQKTQTTTLFHPDGSQTQAISYPMQGLEISQWNRHHQQTSLTKINAQGSICETTQFHSHGTQTKTVYHQDNRKTRLDFDQKQRNTCKKEFDQHNMLCKKTIFHDDRTQSTTLYQTFGRQSIKHIDEKGKLLSRTEIFPDGKQVHATYLEIVAWHEASHALSYLLHHPDTIIQKISIQPNLYDQIEGCVVIQELKKYDICKQEYELKIMSQLCGGVGEQIRMEEPMLTHDQTIIEYFAQPQFKHDTQQAEKYAENCILQTSPKVFQKDIDAYLIRCYKKAYQFIFEHKDQVALVAQALLENNLLNSATINQIVTLKK